MDNQVLARLRKAGRAIKEAMKAPIRGDATPVPVGTYAGEILAERGQAKTALGLSQKGGLQALLVVCISDGGEQNGRLVFIRQGLEDREGNPNQVGYNILLEWLSKLDASPSSDKPEEIANAIEQCIGKTVEFSVVQRPNSEYMNYRIRREVRPEKGTLKTGPARKGLPK